MIKHSQRYASNSSTNSPIARNYHLMGVRLQGVCGAAETRVSWWGTVSVEFNSVSPHPANAKRKRMVWNLSGTL